MYHEIMLHFAIQIIFLFGMFNFSFLPLKFKFIKVKKDAIRAVLRQYGPRPWANLKTGGLIFSFMIDFHKS